MRYIHIDNNAFTYALLCCGAGLMNNVFTFYYVKVFVNKYHVSEYWFQIAQDNKTFDFVRTRKSAILCGILPFVISFLVPWFPWDIEGTWIGGLHLIVSLCFYDAMFTFVVLAQCCLFTEFSEKYENRLRIVRYSVFSSFVGALSVSACEYTSGNLSNFLNFEVTCVLIAFISFGLIRYAGGRSATQYDVTKEGCETGCARPSSFTDMLKDTWYLLKQRDFAAFYLMNFCQILHTCLHANFMSIMLDILVPEQQMTVGYRSVYFWMQNFFPGILVLFMSPIVHKFGYYSTFKLCFITHIINVIIMWLAGQESHTVFLTVMLFDCMLANAAFWFFNFPISDCADKEMRESGRTQPMSSMFFGTNALVTKPAVSVLPMAVMHYLNIHNYDQFKKLKSNKAALTDNAKKSFKPIIDELSQATFQMILVIILGLALLRLFIWRFYTIRDSHRKTIVAKEVVIDKSDVVFLETT